MKLVIEQCTLVVAGSWNKGILAPEWVGKTLFAGKDVSCEVAFLPPAAMQMRLMCDGLLLIPANAAITIGFLASVPDFTKACSVAHLLTSTLTHTPVSGVGLNLGFILSPADVSTKLQEAMNAKDESELVGYGYQIERREVLRTLRAEDHLINFKLTQDVGGVLNANFNFHKDCDSTLDAGEWLARLKEMDLTSKAEKLMRAVYELTEAT